MTQQNATAKEDGASDAPSSMTLAQLLHALTLGGRLTLRVGDPPSATTLTATTTPGAPITTGPLAGPPSGPPPTASGSTTTSGGGGTATAVASAPPAVASLLNVKAAAQAAAPLSAPGAPVVVPCESCSAAGCLPPARLPSPIDISDGEDEVDDLADARWYVVTRGRRVGVFPHWHMVAPLVVSFPRACFARCGTRASAEAAFASALSAGNVSTT
ncbi:hypothetical protein Hypma_004163 [Hypsizygus marmoreus]|uniref:Ribonuclease H1 N-terminal domain-containing protein n=1 Tax=Hypsizygus marmoreus TaxID=39966 RepID=A0A369J9I7_HYPMA|nr:hypothetical protein Hypma_004163 [Hypsizygus marmoreus]